jgi:predicted NAD/FAD-dependent oxidoreductase
MKKLIVIMLVAMIPFITMAQKRSKKDKKAKQEVKIPTVNFMVITGMAITPNISKEEMIVEITDNVEGALMRQKLREKGLKISFDFGTQVPKEMKELIVEARRLHSMTDAVNVLTKRGWEFSGSDIQTDENVTYYYYYMQRK